MGVNNYTYTGEALTESFEGYSTRAYQDSKGVWTIGIGHTGPEVVEGLVWTDAQIKAAFLADTQWAQDAVNQKVTIPITQDENNALVDLLFNIGEGNFESSTLLKDLNAGQFEEAAAQFDRWDYAGGKELAGLLRRRQAETSLFES
jgi:lysozyme